MMVPYRSIGSCCALLAAAMPLAAQSLPDWLERTKVSGVVFGDVYVMAANHNEEVEGADGLWFRRVYLTLDSKLAKALAFRIRFEMNSAGDFKTSSNLTPFVKDLYVRWSRGNHQIFLGMASSPTWDVIEAFWGARDVEKTPLDLQRMGSSRDIGLLAKGYVDAKGKVRYHIMLGQGAGTKDEVDQDKKAYGALSFHPVKGLMFEVYADYEGRPGDNDRNVLQGFAGYEGAWGKIGAMYARQRRNVEGDSPIVLRVASGFVVIKAHERVKLMGRVDRMLDPNPEGSKIPYLPVDNTAESTLLLGGIDVAMDKRFHLIPNLEAVLYHDATPKPGSDLMLRTTFSVTF